MTDDNPFTDRSEEVYKRQREKWASWGFEKTDEEITRMLDDSQESYDHYREMWRHYGNLSESEITELLHFNFIEGPSTVQDQVRKYYLGLKIDRPERAEQMAEELDGVLKRGINGLEDVKAVCLGLGNYWSGFTIHYEGEVYSAKRGKFGTSHELNTPPSKWKPDKESKLVQISEGEAGNQSLEQINLSGRGLELANDGSLMLTVPPVDRGPVTVNSDFELTPEGLEGQLKVPEGSTHYSVRWGAVMSGNMFENGKSAYVRFYGKDARAHGEE